MDGEWFWPVIMGGCVVALWAIYVWREERLSRIRFPDDQHEHGPFGQ